MPRPAGSPRSAPSARLEATGSGGTPCSLPSIPDAPCSAFHGGSAGSYQRCHVGQGSYLAGVDVVGPAASDDYPPMDAFLPQQRDRIDG